MNYNGKNSIELLNNLPRYRRNYVRFRQSSSRSRSREKTKIVALRPTIDYRAKLILLILQTLSLFHLCSVIYCHQKHPFLAARYTLITLILLNFLTYSCVQYDTQQVEHGRLLLGESPLLFLFWYGGLLGGGWALLNEKHKHLRSQAFRSRLKLITFFNATWPFLVYILHMYRNECSFIDASRMLLPLFEA
ncbi:unnamed protein product [Adineta ricciae]|uniref:Uncharacterized protein n=1 Tax=Adineta ricciae TaxID=249248 RepID=A0A814SEP9_ADIRI|nr:unnamed protein product [Adineta ricciae]CAF1399449.1 unnamed protein product [Adineta ricciae]